MLSVRFAFLICDLKGDGFIALWFKLSVSLRRIPFVFLKVMEGLDHVITLYVAITPQHRWNPLLGRRHGASS